MNTFQSLKKTPFRLYLLAFLFLMEIVTYSEPASPQFESTKEVVLGLGSLEAVAVSPVENRMATVSRLGLFLWDTQSGKILRRFDAPLKTVHSMCFSPDGEYILAGIELRDVETGSIIHRYGEENDTIYAVAYSPLGDRILTGGLGGVAIVWDVDSEKEICRFSEHTASIDSAAFSPDGKNAVTGSSDFTACLWDAETGQESIWLTWHIDSINAVAVSPDGKWILTGSHDSTAILWGMESGEAIHVFDNNESSVLSVAFSNDGLKAVTGSADGTTRVWDVQTGNEIQIFQDKGRIIDAVFSLDDECILTRINNQLVKQWEIGAGSPIRAFSGHVPKILTSAFVPNNGFLLTGGGYPGSIYLWNANTGEIVREFSIEFYTRIEKLAVSPDGRYCLVYNPGKEVLLMDLTTGETIFTFLEKFEIVRSIALSPDGEKAMAVYGGYAEVWDVETQNPIHIIYPNEVVPSDYDNEESDYMEFFTGGAFSPMDDIALVTGGGAFIWDTASGDVIRTFANRRWEGNISAFSPDGKQIANAFRQDNSLEVADAETTDTIWRNELSFESNYAASVTYSPDGETIALSSSKNENRTSRNGSISLWDAKTGTLAGRHCLSDAVNSYGNIPGIHKIEFSPDGNKIAAVCDDGTVRLFDANEILSPQATIHDFSIYERSITAESQNLPPLR